jgi:hypothetical protein
VATLALLVNKSLYYQPFFNYWLLKLSLENGLYLQPTLKGLWRTRVASSSH